MEEQLAAIAEQLGMDELTADSDTVDMEEKGLLELPLAICELQAVEELFLDKNELTFIPPEIGGMGQLREFNARSNKLDQELPPEMGNISTLEALFLEDNKLTWLFDTIGNCKQLQGINANNNELTGFPESLCECAAMEGLYADFNQIVELPENIGNLSNLTEVHTHHLSRTGCGDCPCTGRECGSVCTGGEVASPSAHAVGLIPRADP